MGLPRFRRLRADGRGRGSPRDAETVWRRVVGQELVLHADEPAHLVEATRLLRRGPGDELGREDLSVRRIIPPPSKLRQLDLCLVFLRPGRQVAIRPTDAVGSV